MPDGTPRGDDDVFAAQVLRYLDGRATVQDLSELKEALAARPRRAALFVRLCRLHGELGEMLAPLRVAVPASVATKEPTGAPDRPTTGDPPTTIRPPEETVEYVEDQDEETTH